MDTCTLLVATKTMNILIQFKIINKDHKYINTIQQPYKQQQLELITK